MTKETSAERLRGRLELSEERFRQLIDVIPYGVEDIDVSGIILLANPAHHKQYDYDQGELIGKSILDLVATESEREQLKEYLAYLVREQPAPAIYYGRKRTKTGRVFDVKVAWNYRRNEQGHLVCGQHRLRVG